MYNVRKKASFSIIQFKLYPPPNRKFSYTIYDPLGRVIEVGEKTENNDIANLQLGVRYFRDIFGAQVSGQYNPKVIDDAKLLAWVSGDGQRNEVTRSYYDVFNTDFYDPNNININQDNQRKRIAHVAYYSVWDDENTIAVQNYDHATHFVYDIHGNVKKLVQDNKKLEVENQSIATQRFKTMDYAYDLISGNVHRVSVQSGEEDQWHHAYTYDADNRIETVYSNIHTPLYSIDTHPAFLENELSENGGTLGPSNSDWQLEAKYFYYDHGPLARTELGNELQGLDYIYNLQGWLKGINATSLDNTRDPGTDGLADSPNADFSKDVMAFSLHYFDGDYAPINPNVALPANTIAPGSVAESAIGNAPNLYNGNIRFMQTTLTKIDDGTALPMLNAYKYDQLNRLLEARSYTDGLANNLWNPTAASDKYHNKFTYDANGNILTQQRRNSAGTMLDDLTYHYQLDVEGNIVSNRLYHVNDAVGLQNQGDLPNQITSAGSTNYDNTIEGINSINNYQYDDEGRLIRDLSERIELIEWRVDSKVKRITFQNNTNTPSNEIKNNLEFDYDAFGRRVAKHEIHPLENVLIKSTYYVLDASGNTMNTYIHKPSDPGDPESEPPFQLTERVIYGASRLGLHTKKVDLLSGVSENVLISYTGEKLYEMSNHLGNVLTVINDIKLPISSGGVDVDGYLATIVSTADYSPFGVQLDGRTESAESYRYGYQGSEKDDEVKGGGNSYTTEFRMLDPRLGRWLSIDPVITCWESPYTVNRNNPIIASDPDGADPITGIVEALTSFGISVALDFITSYLIEGKSAQESFDDIGWWRAGWDAVKSYAIASVTPPGAATALKLKKISNSKAGKITVSIVEKMTIKAMDNYSKGKYNDKNGDFDFDKVDFGELFFEAALETLIEGGLKKASSNLLKTLKKENKDLYAKLKKFENKINNGESSKRQNNYRRRVIDQKEKRNSARKEYIKSSATEKAKKEAATNSSVKVLKSDDEEKR